MTKQTWKRVEVLELLEIDDDFLVMVEEEEIVAAVADRETGERFYTFDELERLRLAKILLEEMEVNLAGVDIIVRMRQELLETRRQFDAILEDIAGKLRERLLR
ncbi:MAG: MerR family transcriptional regulator [Deltaproteobacteria bacterium]|nr:MerR family transcriptional regulator [Deltaproteobacteria bacterium]